MKQAVLITWFSIVISLAISSLAVAELTPYSLAITFPGSETVEIPISLMAEPEGAGLSAEPDLRLPTPGLTGACVPTTSQASEAVPLVCLQSEPAGEPAGQASSLQLWSDSGPLVQYRLIARPANTSSGIRVSRADIPHLIRLLSLFGFESGRLASLQSSAPAYIYRRDNCRTLTSPLFWGVCGLFNVVSGVIFGSCIAWTGNLACSAGFISNPLGSLCCFGVWHHRSSLPQWNLRLLLPFGNEMPEEGRSRIRQMASNLIERGRAQLESLIIDSTDQESDSRRVLAFRVYLPDHIQTEEDAINYLDLPEDLEGIVISREGTDVQPE